MTNDTNSYFTLHKRKVKGGGGIYPDYFVPLDTAYDVHSYASLRSIVPDFVYSNSDINNQIVKKYPTIDLFAKQFEVSDDLMKLFFKYAANQKIIWNHQKLATFEPKLKIAIKSYFAKQYFKTEGFYTIINASDPVIQKAKSVFNNPHYIFNNK
jgi:carboxyl-terminal processing protease